MNHPKIYKRNGYEFQVVESSGAVARAVGRKGKYERHEVLTDATVYTYDSEEQAKKKYERLTE